VWAPLMGGAGTTSGTTFQEDVAAYFACSVLAERDATPPLGLPPETVLVGVSAEAKTPVDDVAVDTSSGGRLFIQAKRNLGLSDSATSELRKVIRQFVRQSIAGILTSLPSRPLDLARDRLVLVAGHAASNPVRTTLRVVLDKLRGASNVEAWRQTASSFNLEEKAAFDRLTKLVLDEWKAETGNDPQPEQELALIQLIHVFPLDLRRDSQDLLRAHDLLRNSVIRDSSRSEETWNALIAVCREFSPKHTGGDLSFFRTALERLGIPLRTIPSYQPDIDALRSYTATRLQYLERFSRLTVSGQTVTIARPVVSDLRGFARQGHVVIVGEPGAGKSGCLHDLVRSLLGDGCDTVLLTADLIDASSPESVASELGISGRRLLVDVLANWTGDRESYLVIDALDAARSGLSLHVLHEVLRDIRERASRWRIVASIREYDLRASEDVQDLFRGKPHPARFDARFRSVRHLYVDRLTDSELAQLDTLDARLASSVRAAPVDLRKLLRNPFNLRLLCDLVDGLVPQSELNEVRARFGLLELYWRRRVESPPIARRLLLTTAVAQMVTARSLYLTPQQIGAIASPQAEQIDLLLSDGVLVEALTRQDGLALLCFAHNILFDFAVARYWLQSIDQSAVARLSDPQNDDLIVALYPSISIAFEGLWYAEDNHERFWGRAMAMAEAQGIRLVGKIIAATVAAELYRTPADLRALLDEISGQQSTAVQLLRHTITAAVTRHQGNPSAFPFLGNDAQDWLGLAVELTAHLDVMNEGVRFLLEAVPKSLEGATEIQLQSANAAALALVRYGLSSGSNIRLVRSGLEVSALTIAARPQETAAVLALVLEPENIARGGHEWLLPVTEYLATITSVCPDLGLQIVDAAFSSRGSGDDKVPMGGRILSLVFNKRDMFGMARHRVSEAFPKILASDVATATRMVLRILSVVVRSEHSTFDAPAKTYEIVFRGRTAKFKPDGSYIWAQGSHNQHEDWFKVLETFCAGVIECARTGRMSELDIAMDVIAEQNDLAIIWAQLLVAGQQSPQELGPALCELLSSTVILGQLETRTAAGELLRVAYPHLSASQRLSVEGAVRRLPGETPGQVAEYANERRDRILGCLPVELIQSPDLRAIRKDLEDRGTVPPNRPDFSISSEWTREDDDWWLRREGVDPGKPENTEVLEFGKRVEGIPNPSQGQPLSPMDAESTLPLLEEFEHKIEAAAAADQRVLEQAEDQLFAACARLAGVADLRVDSPVTPFVKSRLLRAAASPRPAPGADGDAAWDEDRAAWGSPNPRIDAALGLMLLASRPNSVDPEVLSAIERLANDEVAAVRFQVLTYAGWLYKTAPDLLWRLIERGSRVEPRLGILTSFADNVLLRLPDDSAGRLRGELWRLYRRVRRRTRAKSIRGSAAIFCLRAALWRQDPLAESCLAHLAAGPWQFSDETNAVVHACRELLRHNDPRVSTETNELVRTRGFEFLSATARAVRDQARKLRARHSTLVFDKWPIGDRDQLVVLHQLAHNIASEVYFASGAHRSPGTPPGTGTEAASMERAKFLREGAELFDILCDIEFVEAAYNVLQTLEFLSGADPRRVLTLVAKVVRRAASDGIQYESLASDLIVRMVERYLAEHAMLFQVEQDARVALLDILDEFVAAGWPSATRLTYRLGDVFR
jgi:hypothetical protein